MRQREWQREQELLASEFSLDWVAIDSTTSSFLGKFSSLTFAEDERSSKPRGAARVPRGPRPDRSPPDSSRPP
jgi:hypothetical protein